MAIYYELIKILRWAVILIPFIVGLYNYRKLDKALKYLFYFVTCGTISQIVNYILVKAQFQNTLFLSYLYYPMAFLFLGFFYKELFKGFIRDRLINVLILMYFLYSLVNVLFMQGVSEYASWPGSVAKIVFLVASVVFFYKTMLEAKVNSLWNEPLIWINFAILLYYAGGLSFSLLLNIALDDSMEFAIFISRIFTGLNAIFYLLITVGILKALKQKKVAEKSKLKE